jgi:nitrite reductase/ring-hydroxylating ferredoxin subunit
MPEDPSADGGFVELIEAAQLWDGEMESFDVDGAEVLVLKVDGQVRAYDGSCPHQSASLVEGELDSGVLTCRVHEWQFDALTGAGVNPQDSRLTPYDVRVSDGMICVRLRVKASAQAHAYPRQQRQP